MSQWEKDIEYRALAAEQVIAIMGREARRRVDDILYPERAAMRRLIRNELLRKMKNLDGIRHLANRIRARTDRG